MRTFIAECVRMTIQLLSGVCIAGAHVGPPSQVSVAPELESDLVSRGAAKYVTGNPSVRRAEPLISGVWAHAPSVFRLLLVGSGVAIVDARDVLGNVDAAVATFTANDATNQIEFPYLGDDAVELRVTFPSTLTVEVLQ